MRGRDADPGRLRLRHPRRHAGDRRRWRHPGGGRDHPLAQRHRHPAGPARLPRETFEAENPGSTLEIEEQDWNGLVPRLQTALASEEQTPDVVEIGNTQSPTFTYAGAFVDITDMYSELGGDDLLEGFVQAGSADGAFYAAPYYSGARAVFYNKDMFAAAGVEVPTTLEEFTQVATTLQAAPPPG